jgi:hypothetical protein
VAQLVVSAEADLTKRWQLCHSETHVRFSGSRYEAGSAQVGPRYTKARLDIRKYRGNHDPSCFDKCASALFPAHYLKNRTVRPVLRPFRKQHMQNLELQRVKSITVGAGAAQRKLMSSAPSLASATTLKLLLQHAISLTHDRVTVNKQNCFAVRHAVSLVRSGTSRLASGNFSDRGD